MNKTILVVDDEPEIVQVLKARLEASSYQIITASDGAEALKKVRQENPELIILDVMLPILGGYEVCTQLKSQEKTKNIPVVMLTAKISPLNQKIAYHCGADAYIVKPYTSILLLEKVEELLT